MTFQQIEHRGKYGTTTVGKTERIGRGYFRRDLYLRDEDGQEYPASVVCDGPADLSPHHSIADGYDPSCACCWLNHPHTIEHHISSVRKAVR
jgi:hypothetical protein